MINLNMKSTNHNLEKQNLVTRQNIYGLYDEYKCTQCGIHGKRYGLSGYLQVDGRFSKSKVASCPDAKVSKSIKIIQCNAFGKHFENLIPGSVHKIVSTPPKQNNDNGVWVMGTSEPVKVLFDEFYYEE